MGAPGESRATTSSNAPFRQPPPARKEVVMFGIAWSTWVVVGSLVVLTLLIFAAVARMIRKAGPNEALIVYGFRGTRVVKGHGTLVFPMLENCRELSLELMSFDVAPQQDLYTKQGVAVL